MRCCCKTGSDGVPDRPVVKDGGEQFAPVMLWDGQLSDGGVVWYVRSEVTGCQKDGEWCREGEWRREEAWGAWRGMRCLRRRKGPEEVNVAEGD